LFLGSSILHGQSTIQLGSGTSELLGIPFYGTYDYGWSSMVYLKEEINTSGWSSPGRLSKIAFQFYNSPSNYLTNNQKIYIAHTSAASVDGTQPDASSMTLVYDGSINWTIPAGLPNNSVSATAFDSDGNKWIGTSSGLTKFDGTNWTVYNTSNSGIPSNSVWGLAIDGGDIIWIATFGGGLVKFDGTNWTTYNTGNSSIPTNYLYFVTTDASGNKWIGSGNGLIKFDGTDWTTYNTLSGLPNNSVYSVAIDGDNHKWIATYGGGLAKFDGIEFTVYNTSSGLASNNCYDVAIDGSGNKWIATYGGGLSKFDGTNWTTYNTSNGLPATRCITVAAESNGNIWVGFENNGVSKFDGSSWTNYTPANSSLPSYGINDVAIQSGSVKWIGTINGLAKLDGSTWTIYQKPDWQEIEFTTPFDWNNVDNILIYYENRDGSKASGYPTFKSYMYYTVYRSQYKVQDGSFPTGITQSLRNYRPNLKMTIGDIPYPFIYFTPLPNTSLSSNRTLSNVSISDPDGVNTNSGTKPRLYYKRSTDANTYVDNTSGSNGWKYVETSSGSSPFSFTIDNSLLYQTESIPVGTVIQYFIVAQDLASTPNVGISSSTFNSNPTSVALTADAFPISDVSTSYTISQSFSGEILVGSGQTYTSLTADGETGFFKAINEGFVTGNITVKITSDLTESGGVALNQTNEENGSNFTITIQPNEAVNKTISGPRNNEGLIRLNGVDRLIIDGRYSGAGNYLTFMNTETYGGSKAVIQLLSSATAGGCTDVTIRNCNISLASVADLYCIYAGGATLQGLLSFTGGYNHDNLSIIDNILTKALVGVFAVGQLSYKYDNIVISGNTIGSENTENYIIKYGLMIGYINGGTITKNNILNLIYSSDSNPAGIYVYSSSQNLEISKNKINSIKPYTTGYGAAGIDINAGSSANITISNNVIYDIIGTGSSAGNDNAVYGIRIRNSQSGINIYYNSINLYGEFSYNSNTIQSCALYIGSSCTSLDIRNNILANSIYNSHLQGTGTRAYAIFSSSANTAFTNINYNNYYASGTQKVLGYLSSDKSTITEWQTATGKDANSKAINPDFSSNDNLKPFQGSGVLNSGTPVSGITTDFENVARSETTPSIGAYENGVATSNVVGWCNLQSPGNTTIDYGANTDVFARAYIEGITPAAGTTENLEVWIGISTDNTDPATWHNWTTATFTQQQGDNDEYKITVGAALDMGTYYVASRFRYQNGPYRYGGYSSGGGGFWNGTSYVNGVLTVNTFTTIPYVEKFSTVTTPNLPPGWYAEDTNNDDVKWITSNYSPKSQPYALIFPSTWSVGNDWVFTPGFNLTAGVTYEISFYYKSNDAGYVHKLQMKYGLSKNSSAMTSNAIFYNDNITHTTHQKASFTVTPGSSELYYFGWHCFSSSGYKPQLIVDDFAIRIQPAATNTQTISAGSTALITFTGTVVKIQFTENNGGELEVTSDKVNASPGGSLPEGLTNLLQQYWCVTTEGTVNGIYCFTLDLTGIGGISNYSTIHLLKRNDANSAWTDIGVPTDVSQAPIVKWCYPSLTSFSEFGIGGGDDNLLPVELSTFSAKIKINNVFLEWQTATEVDNYGFEVERCEKSNIEGETWQKIGFVQGHGNSNSYKTYSFTDKNLQSRKFLYRLKMINTDGSFEYSNEVEVEITLPTEFTLSQNYPNPFNPTTKIDYQLPFNSEVKIELFSITGERVAVIVNQQQEAGYYTVEINSASLELSSGVYIYRIEWNDKFKVKRMMLIK
jgi:hypothetical protein